MGLRALSRTYYPPTVEIVTWKPSIVGFENYCGIFNWLKWQVPVWIVFKLWLPVKCSRTLPQDGI
jgi:hypothetical protein